MTDEDFLWLEEVEGDSALAWVQEMNDISLPRLEGDERFDSIKQSVADIYNASDRIPYGEYFGGMVHNFWQDEKHVRGIWRYTSLESYKSSEPVWETILDIDELAEEENENWVFKGYHCLAPDYERCIVSLSRGGSDATVSREFDTKSKRFIEDGFKLPEAKTRLTWLDIDTLLVATDVGPDSLTTSGYARFLKRWSRGTHIDDAPTILEGRKDDMLVSPMALVRPEGRHIFLVNVPQFFESEQWYLDSDGEKKKVPFPIDADFQGVFQGRLLALLRTDWQVKNERYTAGSLVAIDMNKSLACESPVDVHRVYVPECNIAINDVSVSDDSILISVLEDVNGVLYQLKPADDGSWQSERLSLPDLGSLHVTTSDCLSGIFMINYESYLVPNRLYLVDDGNPEVIKSSPERFDAAAYVTEQKFVSSPDGTRVPYFVVRAKDLAFDGSAPTLLGAYGGFELANTPAYLTALGIEWLRHGGVYVIANIRGGGEYGPAWHQAALHENRPRAFEDFIAVAEDLISRHVTSASRLAIRGGSNGGLLVGAVTTQRPELFGAVICAVPLLDMLRYNKLSAGASWMAEYGDPDIPEQRTFIEKYSPYQNVNADISYPEIFFWTNTRDDRVHPSHARRMVARMMSQGHSVLYFENTEGGHGGGANLMQLARTTALELVYLLQKIGVSDS